MNNKERFIVKDIVCDYAVYDTVFDVEDEGLICICNSARNANLIADILNTDNSKPNESVSWYDQQLAEKDKEIAELKKQLHHQRHITCEEIRERLKQFKGKTWYSSNTSFLGLIDQIEKGEKR